MTAAVKTATYGIGAAVAIVGALWIAKRAGLWTLQGAAAGAAAGVVHAAGDAAAGVVLGLGDAVGLQRTAPDQCEADLAAGNYWAASFSCTAPRFLEATGRSVFGSMGVSHAEAERARAVDRQIAAQQPSGGYGVENTSRFDEFGKPVW